MNRRSLLALAVTAIAGLAAVPAAAQTFPAKPITFIVPYAPGGISDTLARATAVSLEEELKQPVIVVNKPSPGIVLGLTEVSKARPDGYTIGIWANSAYVFPKMMKTAVPYDGIDSFTFLRSYGEFVIGVAVKTDSPFKTLADLMEAGKKEPGKFKYGSIGINSGQHLQFEYAARQAGARFVHIPQTGSAANVANVLGGHLDFLSDASSWTPQVKQGLLRLLAISGQERNPFFPDVPTYAELGFKEQLWGRGSIVAPAGLPADVQAKLEAALDKAFGTQRVKDATAGIAQPITSIPGSDMKAWAIADRKRWEEILATQ